MFGGKAIALAKIRPLIHFRFPIWTLTISPFSVWSIHTGWIATSTLAGLIVTIKVVGLFLVQGDYTDPFARYDAIMPGNPISVLSAYHCSVSQSRINGRLNLDHFSCAIFPQDGFFDIIHVEGRNGKITELTFYATHVSLGELALHWKPVVRPKANITFIGWSTHNYLVEVYKGNVGGYPSEVYGKDLQYVRQVHIFTVRRQSN
jgi:hypothetical protein